MSEIYLPPKIRVGYQARADTYTGKLAYVIYYDEKGKAHKEASWNSWRNKVLGETEYENVPIEGFVLNKKVGGYAGDWGNFRQAYVRVYDPRDFEFEITVKNLLYILENTSSIKGKGLEGEFLYGWDGSDLILVPTSSPDYARLKEYADIRMTPDKITSKTIVPGGIYVTKNNEKCIYLGRFQRYDTSWKKVGNPMGEHYFFRKVGGGYLITRSLSGRFVKIESSEPVPEYADLMEKLEHEREYSPVDDDHVDYVPITREELFEISSQRWSVPVWIQTDSGMKHAELRGQSESAIHVDDEYIVVMSSSLFGLNNHYSSRANVPAADLFGKYQIHHLQKYLKNGKTYGEGYYW